jgi:glycosyltransferase involved in cell wall biosynthesis
MAEAVRGLSADPAAARRMGAAGRAAVERHFSRGAMAEKLALIVEEMRGTHG